MKIGGTSRTATHRARELVAEYGTAGAAFSIIDRHAVADWFAVEQAAHRMLSDRRLPRSELFQVSPAEASKVIRAAAAAHARPWAPSVWLRWALLPPSRRPGSPWRRYRRGTNWLPFLLGLLVAVAGVVVTSPQPASWWPAPVARSILLLERL